MSRRVINNDVLDRAMQLYAANELARNVLIISQQEGATAEDVLRQLTDRAAALREDPEDSMKDPFADPVREAIHRYMMRFPDAGNAALNDPMFAALWKQMERTLVAADIAMQDEGLDHEQRRRVVSSALYGGPDAEEALQRMTQFDEQVKVMETTSPDAMMMHLDADGKPFLKPAWWQP
jgi:flagellar biosynthesis regulator FlaF